MNRGSDDITSISARERTLEFVGTVYVEPADDADDVLWTVRRQAQTAFGPLRTSEAAVASRELKTIDTTTFVKRPVKVVDPNVPNDPGKDMIEVRYTYRDQAVVGAGYASRSAIPLALLNPLYAHQSDRLLKECTRNDQEAHDFISTSGWYVFEPNLPQCQSAIVTETKQVEADRKRIADPNTQVAKSEVDRLYIPIEAKLGPDTTTQGRTYPEYHRLYQGGVEPNKLVISLVYGLIDHDNKDGPDKDSNWGELVTTMRAFVGAPGEYQIVPGPDDVDLAEFKLTSGTVLDHPSISGLFDAAAGTGKLWFFERPELTRMFAQRLFKKWLAIEKPIKVQIGNEAPRDFAIKFLVYFGAEQDSTPHHYATKNSDVMLYNGHSYIGFGPLDPSNFKPEDFPKSYQLFWIDGCVSYNYYNKDYFPLKEGATRNLDTMTNGLEAPARNSGRAMGQFLARLLDGTSASYRDLLQAASATDSLRVVDGEIDNEFSPDKYPIKILPR